MRFTLASAVANLVVARNQLRSHYQPCGLNFTLDGKLVGDIGEAVAAELFGLRLVSKKGIDGYTSDNRSVQVKASGTGGGALFRCVDSRSDYLLYLEFDFDQCRGEVVYNGPERRVLNEYLPPKWEDQRGISSRKLRHANGLVEENERLVVVRDLTQHAS